jgi:hypothetical protein
MDILGTVLSFRHHEMHANVIQSVEAYCTEVLGLARTFFSLAGITLHGFAGFQKSDAIAKDHLVA